MRRVRAAAWVVGAFVASAAVAGPAAALAPTKVGWWSEAQQVPGASAPAPPGASGDGITVTAGPNGPASYGAVRYDEVGSGNATLTLKSGSAMSLPPGVIWRPPILGCFPHGSGKAVAALRDGLDIALAGSPFHQGLAQNGDVVREIALLDKGAGPD